jgi:hypothetical protein
MSFIEDSRGPGTRWHESPPESSALHSYDISESTTREDIGSPAKAPEQTLPSSFKMSEGLEPPHNGIPRHGIRPRPDFSTRTENRPLERPSPDDKGERSSPPTLRLTRLHCLQGCSWSGVDIAELVGHLDGEHDKRMCRVCWTVQKKDSTETHTGCVQHCISIRCLDKQQVVSPRHIFDPKICVCSSPMMPVDPHPDAIQIHVSDKTTEPSEGESQRKIDAMDNGQQRNEAIDRDLLRQHVHVYVPDALTQVWSITTPVGADKAVGHGSGSARSTSPIPSMHRTYGDSVKHQLRFYALGERLGDVRNPAA